MRRVSHLPPVKGVVVRIDDRYTGFSPEDPKDGRPYLVIGVFGRQMRVVPQSTKGMSGVLVPEDALEGLEKGRFVPWSRAVSTEHARPEKTIGYLSEAYVNEIIDQWERRRS